MTQNLNAVLTLNGLMNSGTGQLSFGASSSAGRLTIGASNGNELDLVAASAPVRIDVAIQSGNNSASIAVSGSNSVILNGANTYLGGTTIAGGTLQLGNGGTTGTLASAAGIADNGTLIINHSDALNISNSITGSGNLTQAGGGTLTLSGANTYTGATAVMQGKLVFASSTSTLSSLTVADGGTAAVTAGGSRLLSVANLSLNNTGTLDLTDNSLIIPYTGTPPMGAIGLLLKRGYNAGAWNGTGISSSAVTGNPTMSLGYAAASDVGLTTAFGSAVVVKYTRVGDSSLDGRVDLGNDFNLFLQGFISASATSWELGDYNYDGKTDSADFGMFIDGYKAQSNSLGALESAIISAPLLTMSQKTTMLAAVPEPAVLMIPVLIGLLSFRRR